MFIIKFSTVCIKNHSKLRIGRLGTPCRVSGNKFSSAIPNIPPCTLSLEEGQSLIKEFMRETNVILFLKSSFESSELPGCEGKVIGTNFPQGGTVSTGDTLIFIIANSQEDQ